MDEFPEHLNEMLKVIETWEAVARTLPVVDHELVLEIAAAKDEFADMWLEWKEVGVSDE